MADDVYQWDAQNMLDGTSSYSILFHPIPLIVAMVKESTYPATAQYISGKDGSAPSQLAWRGVGALSARVQRHRGVRSAESEWQAETKMASFQGSNSRDIFSDFFCVKIWDHLSQIEYLTVSDSIWVSWVDILLRWGAAFQDEPLRPVPTVPLPMLTRALCRCWSMLIDVSMLILTHAGKHRHVLGIARVGTDSQTILVWMWFDSQLRGIVVPSG